MMRDVKGLISRPEREDLYASHGYLLNLLPGCLA
jgi:hypothetical protein